MGAPAAHANTFNVNSTADILNPAPGVVTLRSAVEAANATAGGNIINLTVAGVYQITLPGANLNDNTGGAFAILPSGGNLTIMNASGGTVIVDGNQVDRVFNINPNFDPANPTPAYSVTMQGFTVTNGSARSQANPDGPAACGGGIRVIGNASLTLTNMVVTNNQATADGGGIAMENVAPVPWTLTLNATVVSNNRAEDSGGGIETDGSGHVVLNAGTVVSDNTALNFGGGICLDAIQVGTVFQTANLALQGVTVSSNRTLAAGAGGGGISNAGNGTVSIANSTIQNNATEGTGGGFADSNLQGTLSISTSQFLNNTATGNGGGISACGPSTAISQSEIDGNTSGGSGGGFFNCGTASTITGTTLANNSATQNGGGIELAATGAVTITNSTLAGNITLNNAGGNGGGIDAPAAFAGTLALTNVTISANAASTGSGGGMFWAGAGASSISAQNTIIAVNTAGIAGPDADNPAGTFTDNGGNLVGISGAGSGNTGFTAATTQTGTTGSPLNPLLVPLQNNGGPTLTLALLNGSPAIDKGLTNALSTDQRGVARPQGPSYDVGAYEFNVGPTPTAKLSVPDLDFGDRGLAGVATQTVTLTNTGTGGLAVTGIAVSGGNSGDFKFTPASGCAAPVTLATSQVCSYTVTFSPAALGIRSASLVFADDTLAVPDSTQTVALSGNGITLGTTSTSLALTSGTSPSTFGTSLTFTATVTPSTATGTINFFDGTSSIGAGPLSGGTAALATSSLSVGTHSITAQYSGDPFDSASTSSAVQQVVTAAATPDFTISAGPASATVIAGSSATVTFTVTPQNGFNQTITFSCSGLPAASQCSFTPDSVTPNGGAVTSTLKITTTATTTTTTRYRAPETPDRNLPLYAWLSVNGLAAGLLWAGAGSDKRKSAGALWTILLCIAVLGSTSALSGCGASTGTKTVTTTITSGTPPGTSQITVLASGGAANHTAAVTLTVN